MKCESSDPQVTSSNLQVQIHGLRVQLYELLIQIHELRAQIHNFKNHLINKISSFPEILSIKSFSNSWDNLRSVSGANLPFYFPTISWLSLQQETKWVNINFERRDFTSPQKSHPPPMIFTKTKCNTHLFHPFDTKIFAVPLENLNLNYFSQYQRWLIRQKLLIKVPPSPSLLHPLLDIQHHQTAIFKRRQFQDVSV